MQPTEQFTKAFETYVEGVRQLQVKNWLTHPHMTPITKFEIGNKYAKVIVGTSVHTFVEIENGDILKAASWRKPAKHARGNIYNENPMQGVGVHGANYLK